MSFEALISPYLNNCFNVSKVQDELLLWHNVFRHYSIQNTQILMTSTSVDLYPIITPEHPGAATCTASLYRAYLSGKGGHTSVLCYLECVSTDKFECQIKGRLPHTKGKEDLDRMYSGGTVFVDHASSMISIYDQVSLRSSDTIWSKNDYEKRLAESGVTVKKNRADNGIYASEIFTKTLKECQQKLSLSGVGSHSQNGVTECAIKQVEDKKN